MNTENYVEVLVAVSEEHLVVGGLKESEDSNAVTWLVGTCGALGQGC